MRVSSEKEFTRVLNLLLANRSNSNEFNRMVPRAVLKRAIGTAKNLAAQRSWLSSEFRRIRQEHLQWDARHQVETTPDQVCDWFLSNVDERRWKRRNFQFYQHANLVKCLAKMEMDFQEFTFVDIGSAKGRSLFAASNFQFYKIVGMGFSPRQHEIAIKNIRSYQSAFQKCCEIETSLSNPSEVEIPPGPVVYHCDRSITETPVAMAISRLLGLLSLRQETSYFLCSNRKTAEYVGGHINEHRRWRVLRENHRHQLPDTPTGSHQVGSESPKPGHYFAYESTDQD